MELEKLTDMTVENAVAIGQLIEISKRTNEDVEKLIRHAEKLEKMNIEQSKLIGRLGSLESTVHSDRKKIKPFYAVMEYPKMALIVLVTAYTFTIYEVRTAIIDHLKPIKTFFGM